MSVTPKEEISCRHVEKVRHHDYCSPIWMAQASDSSAVTETVRGLPANASSHDGSAMHIGLFVMLDT